MVTVIVPHYKKNDHFLERCITSIIQQTYADFELLLIDNSIDSPSRVAQSLSTLDSRIKYFFMPGIGLSGSRNAGIDLANGEYLCFIDSDDFISLRYLETLIALYRENANAVLAYGKIGHVDKDGELLFPQKEESTSTKCFEIDLDFAYTAGNISPCCFLFKRGVIGEIRFDTSDPYVHEERLFLYFLFSSLIGKIVVQHDRIVYWYRRNPESITRDVGDPRVKARVLFGKVYVEQLITLDLLSSHVDCRLRYKALDIWSKNLLICIWYEMAIRGDAHIAKLSRKALIRLYFAYLPKNFRQIIVRLSVIFPRVSYLIYGARLMKK